MTDRITHLTDSMDKAIAAWMKLNKAEISKEDALHLRGLMRVVVVAIERGWMTQGERVTECIGLYRGMSDETRQKLRGIMQYEDDMRAKYKESFSYESIQAAIRR